MRALILIGCVFLVACGGGEAPSESVAGGDLRKSRTQARALLDGLMPEIETFMLHSIGMNPDGGAAERDEEGLARDRDRLSQALAEVRGESESITDATLRGHVIRTTEAFDRWLELDPDQPPGVHGDSEGGPDAQEEELWRRWAAEMRAIDAAVSRYDAALDAAGAPKNRRNRLGGPPPRP